MSTEQRPRYLGLFSVPTPGYTGVPAALPPIPRYLVHVAGNAFATDVPYELLPPETVTPDVQPQELDLSRPTFDVLRVPVARLGDLIELGRRSATFARAPYRSDATLVAGTFGVFQGDTAYIQGCLNAAALRERGLATRVLSVFDTDLCAPDVVTTSSGPHLANVLADRDSPFQGGLLDDVSHGGPTAIYGQNPIGHFWPNLTVDDVRSIPSRKLNVFVSIACDNDGVGAEPNLAAAMYARASVAVVSATATLVPAGLDDLQAGEVDALQGLFEHRENIAQRLHVFRADYYTRLVLRSDNPYRWLNLLAVNLLGDGLVSLAR